MEELLARIIEVAVTLKLIAKAELRTVIVDSIVQEKAISHPSGSKLLETARANLIEGARALGFEFSRDDQTCRHSSGL